MKIKAYFFIALFCLAAFCSPMPSDSAELLLKRGEKITVPDGFVKLSPEVFQFQNKFIMSVAECDAGPLTLDDIAQECSFDKRVFYNGVEFVMKRIKFSDGYSESYRCIVNKRMYTIDFSAPDASYSKKIENIIKTFTP